MYAIRGYTDTNCELDMAKTRLNLLMDRKTKLYTKYFPLTANIKDIIVDGGEENKDKMLEYLHELHEIDIGTGMSLAQEITYQQSVIDKLQAYLNIMQDSLSKMSGIEYQLFYEIAYKGVNISKAVENIAVANNKDVGTIWKNYYKKIKKYVKKLKCTVFIQ